MKLAQLLKNIREPPPESMVGHMIGADGRVMRYMPFVILFNMAWLFFYPIIAQLSFVKVILPTLLSLPVFIYLHLCTYFYGGPVAVRLRYIAGVFLLGFALVPFNLACLGYLIFGYFSTAFSMSTRNASKVIWGVVVAYIVETILLGHDTQIVLSCGLPAVLLGISAIYTAYTTQQQQQLRRSTQEIMRLATLAERERIGRDLHDLLGHTLSVVALKSELARKLIDRDLDAARSEISEVERVARDALAGAQCRVGNPQHGAVRRASRGDLAARGAGRQGEVRNRAGETAP
jgi:two-component system sensor histidine kinase DesK